MPITRSDVKWIAGLARLEVPDSEVERTAGQLSRVLGFVESMRALTTERDEPAEVRGDDGGLRPDGPGPRGLATEEAMAMAPEAESGFFLVPPVLEATEP